MTTLSLSLLVRQSPTTICPPVPSLSPPTLALSALGARALARELLEGSPPDCGGRKG